MTNNKDNRNNNFYGIESFKNNPLSENLKKELCKYLFLNPEITADNAKVFSYTYLKEDYAIKLLKRVKEYVESLSLPEIEKNVFKTLMNWHEVNGLLTNTEAMEFCNYCIIDFEEYLKKLDKIKYYINFGDKKIFIFYLTNYSKYLNETQIDWVLDKYLMLKKTKLLPNKQ